MTPDLTCYGADIKALADLAGDFQLRSPMDVTTWYRREWTAIADILGFAQQLAATPTAIPTAADRIVAMNAAGLAAFERSLHGRTGVGDEQARVQSAFGQDYARTLREWGARQQAAEADIRALGQDDRFMRN